MQRRLEGLARRDLSCRAVRLIALNESVWQVDGCGNLIEYELLCAGRHCSWHRIEPAALRAARDFACPLAGLAAAVPSATRRDFSGCGRAASYSLTSGANHCEWVSLTAYGPGPGDAAAGGYGAPPTTAVPAAAVGDDSLADVVIPPPPGAAAVAPQPITSIPAAEAAAPTPPAVAPEAASDDVVIPPPPP